LAGAPAAQCRFICKTINWKASQSAGKCSKFKIAHFGTGSNYTASAFIKAIDPSAGFATVLYDTTSIAGAGSFSVSTNLTTAPASWIIQYGFSVEGLNSNPANEATLGSVVVAVPEPSTYAAILGSLAALVLLLGRRQRK
jgi:hypothetical protein